MSLPTDVPQLDPADLEERMNLEKQLQVQSILRHQPFKVLRKISWNILVAHVGFKGNVRNE